MKDMFGNEIKVGKMVAYPVRRSSHMWMSYGRVTEVNEGERNPKPRGLTQYYYREWIVEPHLKVRIRARYWVIHSDVLKPKVVKVVKLDRVIVIPHVQFNEEDRKFFELQFSNITHSPVPPVDMLGLTKGL